MHPYDSVGSVAVTLTLLMMANLIGGSINEDSSVCSRESRDSLISRGETRVVAKDEQENETSFKVVNVVTALQNEPTQSNYLQYSYDKEDKIIDAEEERDKLRITSSLMDDEESSDSDNDDKDASLRDRKKGIFRYPRNAPAVEKTNYTSLNSWSTVNLLDEASLSQTDARVINKTQSYSDKFNSVYGEVAMAATANNKAATRSNSGNNRFQNARLSLSTAVKAFGSGLSNATVCDAVGTFPIAASSWDVDLEDVSQMSRKRRSIDSRLSIGNHNHNKRRRGMGSIDIRSELVIMQDKMDHYEVTIQSLQRDNSALTSSKSHLQLMLEQSNKALRNAQLESKVSKSSSDKLTFRLNEMKTELQQAKTKYDQAMQAEENKMNAMKSDQDDIIQNEREKYILEIESLKSQLTSAQETVQECQDVIDRQATKIVNLEVTLAETTTTATDALEVAKQAEEERNFWKSRAKLSPKAKSLAKSFVHTTSYYSCEQETNQPSGHCNICFKGASGVLRWCKCGQTDCNKWAHAQCLAKRKSNVSTSVSHPGTPPPALPLILCKGIEPLIT